MKPLFSILLGVLMLSSCTKSNDSPTSVVPSSNGLSTSQAEIDHIKVVTERVLDSVDRQEPVFIRNNHLDPAGKGALSLANVKSAVASSPQPATVGPEFSFSHYPEATGFSLNRYYNGGIHMLDHSPTSPTGRTWTLEGSLGNSSLGDTVLYRANNTRTGAHIFTIYESEIFSLENQNIGWVEEPAECAVWKEDSGDGLHNVTIYRFHQIAGNQDYLYTNNPNELTTPGSNVYANGYSYDGIVFYLSAFH